MVKVPIKTRGWFSRIKLLAMIAIVATVLALLVPFLSRLRDRLAGIPYYSTECFVNDDSESQVVEGIVITIHLRGGPIQERIVTKTTRYHHHAGTRHAEVQEPDRFHKTIPYNPHHRIKGGGEIEIVWNKGSGVVSVTCEGKKLSQSLWSLW